MNDTHLTLKTCIVRAWRASDADSLQRHADNRKIWINLRDRFPHPYTLEDAHTFLKMATSMAPQTYFAIEVDGQATGGIGYLPHEDVERVSAEIGYWLGEHYWNRGITTDALAAVTALAIERHGLTRVYALPFEYNTASCRVLEKCGYVLEARLRRSAIKDGRIVDQFQYAYVPGV
jgi:RimJ/RimL family protein N-acetyltransferase